MKRAEFEHAVRAAAGVLGVEELLVIGSQALHGSVERSGPGALQPRNSSTGTSIPGKGETPREHPGPSGVMIAMEWAWVDSDFRPHAHQAPLK